MDLIFLEEQSGTTLHRKSSRPYIKILSHYIKNYRQQSSKLCERKILR